MVAIKAAEFAFPRMEAPDLDAMEEFLTHFGDELVGCLAGNIIDKRFRYFPRDGNSP